MKKIKTIKSWKKMGFILGGKLCNLYSKKVWNKYMKITVSILLITGTTIFNNINAQGIEFSAINIVSTKSNKEFSGTLLFEEDSQPIVNAEITFICLKKYIQVKTNKNGYFSFKVSDDLLAQKNLVSFNFENRTSEPNIPENPNIPPKMRYGSRYMYLEKKDFKTEKVYKIPAGRIMKTGDIEIAPKPTFYYYYFNGKKVSKEYFEKIDKKNPDYKKIVLDDYLAKVVLDKDDIKNLYLLFSN
ncbi:hypothetical protein [Chryseobacterium sp. M5A1_1a]